MTKTNPTLARPLLTMAVGRIVLGAASLVAPAGMAQAFGTASELDYMTRIFGARAIALGTAYLLAGPAERTRLQRICVGVDTSDTIAALSQIPRASGSTRRSLAMGILTTGPYAAIGVARLASDLRRKVGTPSGG